MNCRSASAVTISIYAMDVPLLLLDSSTPSRLALRQAAGLLNGTRGSKSAMSSSRKPRSGTRGYAHLVEVNVPVARVWRALPDPRLVRIWSGQEAEIDARKGGLYRIGTRQ